MVNVYSCRPPRYAAKNFTILFMWRVENCHLIYLRQRREREREIEWRQVVCTGRFNYDRQQMF